MNLAINRCFAQVSIKFILFVSLGLAGCIDIVKPSASGFSYFGTDSSIIFTYDSLTTQKILPMESHSSYTELFQDSLVYKIKDHIDIEAINDLSSLDFSDRLIFTQESSQLECKFLCIERNGTVPFFYLSKLSGDTIYIRRTVVSSDSRQYDKLLKNSYPDAQLLYYLSTIRFKGIDNHSYKSIFFEGK